MVLQLRGAGDISRMSKVGRFPGYSSAAFSSKTALRLNRHAWFAPTKLLPSVAWAFQNWNRPFTMTAE
jgi:hypothetical protein